MNLKLNRSTVDIENFGTGFRPTTGVGRFMNSMSSGFNPESYPEYRRYIEMGDEIKEALLAVRQQARDEVAAAAAPKAAATCPWCGATTTPDSNGCCEYCGGAIGG